MIKDSECTWLVDMAYVIKAAKQVNLRLNYFGFTEYLSQYHSRVHSFLFNSYDDSYRTSEGLKRFYELAQSKGMTIRLHKMTGDASLGTHKQRGVDVDLACHMVWQASNPKISTLALTTGDQDLIPAVKMCREAYGTKVILFTFPSAVSDLLEAAATNRYSFLDIPNAILV